jgi:rubrerythrin
MPLQNFGSILNFAADLEAEDEGFYRTAAAQPGCVQCKALLEQFAVDAKKNERTMRETCREHVCEMILEPILNFTRQPFLSERDGAANLSCETVLAKALELETKAENFYREAAAKISAIPEVSRALARTALKRAAHKEKLEELLRPASA